MFFFSLSPTSVSSCLPVLSSSRSGKPRQLFVMTMLLRRGRVIPFPQKPACFIHRCHFPSVEILFTQLTHKSTVLIFFFLYLYCSLAYPVFGLLKNLKSFKLQTFYFSIRVLFLFCKYYKSIFSSPVTDNTSSPHLLPLKALQHQYHILENCSLNKLHLKPLIFEPLFSCAVQTCFGFNMQPSIISILHLPALFGELGLQACAFTTHYYFFCLYLYLRTLSIRQLLSRL